jgi:hypothetical protein
MGPGCDGRGERGSALLEVLMSGMIMAITVLGIAFMFAAGHSYVVADGDDRIALGLAQHKIEALRSLGFGCIPVPSTAPALHAVVPLGASTQTSVTCPDTILDQATRKYNEDSTDDPDLARFVIRTTQVQCADPLTFAAIACPSPVTARLITVDLTPLVTKARPIRVQTVLTLH